jgi:hypothetical protein
MKRIHPLGILLALTATLLMAACKKDAPEAGLPAATHTGANTAGCLINGQPFVATGYGSGLGKVQAIGGGFAEDSLYNLRLNGMLGDKAGTLSLFIINAPRNSYRPLTRVYNLNQNTSFCPPEVYTRCLSHALFIPNGNSRELYGTDAQHTGTVQLTYIDLNHLISAGNFEFTAVSSLDPNKTIHITSGRFDRQQ